MGTHHSLTLSDIKKDTTELKRRGVFPKDLVSSAGDCRGWNRPEDYWGKRLQLRVR